MPLYEIKRNKDNNFELYFGGQLKSTGTEKSISDMANNQVYGQVAPFGATTPVISSNDTGGEYKALGSQLDYKLGTGLQVQRPEEQQIDASGLKPAEQIQSGQQGANGAPTPPPKSSGDVAYDEMLKTQEAGKASAEKWGADKKAEIDALLPKTLALLDSQYASSVTNITGTYGKLIEEQKRINAVNVDRTKAYGLGAGGQYMPLEYTSAVSDQEQKAANAIATLENERTDLLARAKQSRDQGEITTLRENMDALNKIEETMRQRTKDLADEVQKRYELTVAVRKEQETKHQEGVTKMLDAVKVKYWKNFKDAKTEEDKVKIIRKIILESGGTLTDKDFYSVYTQLSGEVTSQSEATAKAKKGDIDIKNVESQIEARKQETAQKWTDLALKKEDKEKVSAMETEVNTLKFTDEKDAEKKRQVFVKKYGEKGKKYWDDVFKDDTGLYNYETGGGTSPAPTSKANDFRAKYKY